MPRDEGKFRRAVARPEHVELAFGLANFGDVDMETADWIDFQLPLGRDLSLDVRQSENTVALAALGGTSV